jgi:hypothetical protein
MLGFALKRAVEASADLGAGSDDDVAAFLGEKAEVTVEKAGRLKVDAVGWLEEALPDGFRRVLEGEGEKVEMGMTCEGAGGAVCGPRREVEPRTRRSWPPSRTR